MSQVVCIAGGDSSGGAGLDVDRQVLSTFGIKPRLISSAKTQQGAAGLIDVAPADPHLLHHQVRKTLGKRARRVVVKVGMLPDAEAVKAVARAIQGCPALVVADPVMGPSAGGSWADGEWLAAYQEHMPSAVSVLTPNLAEARALANLSRRAGAGACAARLEAMGFANVVITGGDSQQANPARLCLDLISLEGQKPLWLAARRLRASCRGSGCTHSSALAAALAQGASMRDAVVSAHMQLAARLANKGAHVSPGMRHLPMLFRLNRLKDASSLPARKLRRPLGICPLVANATELASLCHAQGTGWSSVQLRLKEPCQVKVREQIAACATLAKKRGLDLYVNDHWRGACALRDDHSAIAGVHLGQGDLARADLDAIKLAGLALGVSAHNLFEACAALAAKPSYISFGPVFETTSKRLDHAPLGLAGLARLCDELPLPAVAIGGINHRRAASIARLGLSGAATIQASSSPGSLARLLAAWEKARQGR